MTSPTDRVLEALERGDHRPRRRGSEWQARCPVSRWQPLRLAHCHDRRRRPGAAHMPLPRLHIPAPSWTALDLRQADGFPDREAARPSLRPVATGNGDAGQLVVPVPADAPTPPDRFNGFGPVVGAVGLLHAQRRARDVRVPV